jgi:hypothetical protein
MVPDESIEIGTPGGHPPAYEDNASCGVENRFLESGGTTVIDGDPS